MIKSMRSCFSVTVLVVAVLCARRLDADVLLVENGQPKATIVVAAEPTEQAQHAAQELQTYLERITGAELAIQSEAEAVSGARILVGRSQAVADLGVEAPSGHSYEMNEEGFVVKTIGQDLVLAGNEEWHYRGTVFAVYDLLEELGCRWFFPGPYGEVVPSMETILVPDVDREERPSFRFRNIWYSGWMPVREGDSANLSKWTDCNKMNSLKGLSLPGDGSITRLAPPEKYFESHPHIYALNEQGERVKEMLCLTEPDAVRIAVETITETFRTDPDALTFGFAPPDGYPLCHCERCLAAVPGFTGKGYGDPSLSDLWFSFVNKIAKEVYVEFPERWLLTNGYANRVQIPESVGKLSPNIGIQSAVISACTLHPIGAPNCWQRQSYKQILDRWTEELRCVFIYDYDPGKALECTPFPAVHNLMHDLPYFHERGVWGFWTEGNNSWMVTHLNYYIRAKLMWHADEDVEALVRDYCEAFYGGAADPVEKYIWALEDAVNEGPVHASWGRIMTWRAILTREVRRELEQLLEEAGRLAEDENSRLHVRVLRLVHNHMMAYWAMEEAAAEGDFAKSVWWADEMLRIRDQVTEIEPPLLPHTPDWCKDFSGTLGGHRKRYQDLADKTGGEKGELVTLLPRRWEFKFDPEDKGVVYQWYLPAGNEPWSEIDTTLYWEAQGYADEKGWGRSGGKAWYRTGFHVPAGAEGIPLQLTFPGVYNIGLWVWVNGRLAGYRQGESYKLPPSMTRHEFETDVTDLIRPGQVNHVAVRVNTQPPGRNTRGGLDRRVFLWSPK